MTVTIEVELPELVDVGDARELLIHTADVLSLIWLILLPYDRWRLVSGAGARHRHSASNSNISPTGGTRTGGSFR